MVHLIACWTSTQSNGFTLAAFDGGEDSSSEANLIPTTQTLATSFLSLLKLVLCYSPRHTSAQDAGYVVAGDKFGGLSSILPILEHPQSIGSAIYASVQSALSPPDPKIVIDSSCPPENNPAVAAATAFRAEVIQFIASELLKAIERRYADVLWETAANEGNELYGAGLGHLPGYLLEAAEVEVWTEEETTCHPSPLFAEWASRALLASLPSLQSDSCLCLNTLNSLLSAWAHGLRGTNIWLKARAARLISELVQVWKFGFENFELIVL